MDRLALVIEKLENLPLATQAEAMDYIEQLHSINRDERMNALKLSAGSFSKEEADGFEKAVQECCEHLDG